MASPQVQFRISQAAYDELERIAKDGSVSANEHAKAIVLDALEVEDETAAEPEGELPSAQEISDNSIKVSVEVAQKWLDQGRITVCEATQHEPAGVFRDGLRLYPWSYNEEKNMWPHATSAKPLDRSEVARHGVTGAANRAAMREANEKAARR